MLEVDRGPEEAAARVEQHFTKFRHAAVLSHSRLDQLDESVEFLACLNNAELLQPNAVTNDSVPNNAHVLPSTLPHDVPVSLHGSTHARDVTADSPHVQQLRQCFIAAARPGAPPKEVEFKPGATCL